MDVGGIETEGIGERLDKRGAGVLQAHASLDLGLDGSHSDNHHAAVGAGQPGARDPMMEIKRRAHVDESAMGNTATPKSQANRSQKAGAAEQPVDAGMSDRAGFQGSQGSREAALKALDADANVMLIKTKIGQRREE